MMGELHSPGPEHFEKVKGDQLSIVLRRVSVGDEGRQLGHKVLALQTSGPELDSSIHVRHPKT